MAQSQTKPIELALIQEFDQADDKVRDAFFEYVYPQLKKVIHRRLLGVPKMGLQTTELVHEFYLKIRHHQGALRFCHHGAFYAFAVRVLRQFLADEFRRQAAIKRGGGLQPVAMEKVVLYGRQMDPEFFVLFHQTLEDLEDAQPGIRAIVDLHIVAEEPVKQVAILLGISEHHIKKKLLGFAVRLRQRLGMAYCHFFTGHPQSSAGASSVNEQQRP